MYFLKPINFLIGLEKHSSINYEQALIQIYASGCDCYEGLIEINGVIIVRYHIDKNFIMRLWFKENDFDERAHKDVCFHPDDSLTELLKLSKKYAVAEEVYEFFVKL